MRIAIYHDLPSGGGKRALWEMTRRLAGQHNLDVYTLAAAEHNYCDLRPYAQQHLVFPYQPLPLARSPFGRINQLIRVVDIYRRQRVEREIARQIDAQNYDVAFVHNCQYGQSTGVLKFLKTPTVYYSGEPPRYIYEPPIPRPYSTQSRVQHALDQIDPLPGLYKAVLKKVDYDYTRAATALLVNSAYSRETMYRLYGRSGWVCYLGVDTQRFQPLSLPRQNYVVSVGATVPNKGFDFILRSLALIDAQMRPPLIVVSNSTISLEREYLMTLASELGVRVEFRSMVTDEELTRLYNQALMTVYTPVMEPFGFVPLESMACGTPVVGVREAGVRESVVDGQNGLLTDRDPQQFAEAVKCLILNEDLRERLGKNGRKDVEENWTWARCMDSVEKQLARTAQAGRRG